MEKLILCACGHPIDRHGSDGCLVLAASKDRCTCFLREFEVLDSAIERVAEVSAVEDPAPPSVPSR